LVDFLDFSPHRSYGIDASSPNAKRTDLLDFNSRGVVAHIISDVFRFASADPPDSVFILLVMIFVCLESLLLEENDDVRIKFLEFFSSERKQGLQGLSNVLLAASGQKCVVGASGTNRNENEKQENEHDGSRETIH
jgi:hypothetical protein